MLLGHEQEKTRRGVRGGGQEDVDDFLLHQALNLALGLPGDEGDRPQAASRIFHQNRLPEGIGLLGEHGFQDLLDGAVDAAHHRHAGQHLLVDARQGAPDETGGQRADQGKAADDDQQPQPGNAERQVGRRIIGLGDDRRDLLVDEIDEDPGQVDGDGNGRGDQDAGEEIIAQPRRQTRSCG